MKIFECCPFFCEQDVANIKICESEGQIDQLFIIESNRTFQYTQKEFTFHSDSPIVNYVRLDGDKAFKAPSWGISRKPPFFRLKPPGWKNEAIQRNKAAECAKQVVSDEDIVILSDIDEIIDWRNRDRIIDEVRRRGIITIRLHFTLFYLDLHSVAWPGPPEYSYRVFIMRGDYFKNLSMTSDQLRKAGEHGKLVHEVYCPDEVMGFHHSWLGDADFVIKKIKAYAHTAEDHSSELLQDGKYDEQKIRDILLSGRSLFPGHELKIMNPPPLLKCVSPNDPKYAKHFAGSAR